jgi:cellulose synthase/poly-beta-1,6-N-acetylglucosamine synthase-like glycosyltransferase
MTIVLFCLAAGYAILMQWYGWYWRKIPVFRPSFDFKPSLPLTILIPARNEADNIASCLNSMLSGNYPLDLLDIIVVDDCSEDDTAAIASRFGTLVRVLSLRHFLPANEVLQSHKKLAIETAIAHARHPVIVTTDADCLVPPGWLTHISAVYEAYQPDMVAAPVLFQSNGSLLQDFQALDFVGMMGITGAGIASGFQRMANGANLSYTRAAFEAVDGFNGNTHKASGDDMFLIQKMAKRRPEGIFFLKSRAATVLTAPAATWPDFIQQRLRWGTKNAALPEWSVRLILALVFVFCWSILIAMALTLQGSLAPMTFLMVVATKAVSDYFFLHQLCGFFGQQHLMHRFLSCFILHTLYIPLIGTASLFSKKYTWKGRQVQ